MSNIEQLAEQENNMQRFILPGMAEVGGDFSNEELADDMAGVQLSFPRIKIPSGGFLQFEIPGDDPEHPGYSAFIEGVILFGHPSNAYWPGGEYDEDQAIPVCSSSDSVTGYGDPGGSCVNCELNQWNTGENGKGKACKNMRQLYILRSGESILIQLTLAPTSLKPYSEFANIVFAGRRRATFGSVIRIGLKKMNNGKDDYSVATFQKLYDFAGEELDVIRAYSAGFREQIKYMLSQRTHETEATEDYPEVPMANMEPLNQAPPVNQAMTGTEYAAFLSNNAAVIDGERQQLPA